MTRRGFTVIELLVVLAALGVLLSIAAPRYVSYLDQARDRALRNNLAVLRQALDHYRADQGASPPHLDALVQARYLREVPLDPITERRDSWVLIRGAGQPLAPGVGAIDSGGISDVRSGASGLGRDGTSYGSW